ncbi:MAG: threonine--tRNA ligase [Lachnospiraceae bacterium]|nr:threonine--tRNA ligase [Lachnospiraceae bacterium]
MKVIYRNGEVKEGNFEESWAKEAFWHTTAHILAQAVKRLWPDTKCAIGPAISQGFYYDFAFSFPFGEEHLRQAEEEMQKIVKESLTIQVNVVNKKKAAAYMRERKEDYKLELIDDLPEEETISFYKQGEYVEFCAGPHISNTCHIKAIKLLSIAGAYWRGDEKKQMLTRIYGISFPKASDLEKHLNLLEEMKLRDHRKLGKELALFTIMKQGPGFPVFLPKGMILKNILIDYWRKLHQREGYLEISTPMMMERTLWETSGHWEHYRENMYATVIDDVDFAIKPMSCPGGMLVYQMQPRSYRELPMRLGELGTVHRHEKSGQLHGLMRVRAFMQDDAHIFMTKEQMIPEIQKVAGLIDEVYSKFGFSYMVELSTRPENSIGSEEEWEEATAALQNAMEAIHVPFCINEGDDAFYGPKLDFHLKDSIGRTWQCGTIQLDFQLPQRFGAEYIGADGVAHRPIMIHRVIYGSIERFIGILIEHYAGNFPLWLSPVQVKVLPIAERFNAYAKEIMNVLSNIGIRCELDDKAEKIGFKIREAQLDKVPYMVIVGQKEADSGEISVRKREDGDIGSMKVQSFIELLQKDGEGY